MKAERARILEMLQQGQITVEQAEGLLDALERSYQTEASAAKPETSAPPSGTPKMNAAGLGTSISERVMLALSGAFGGLKGIGSGPTNFGDLTIAKAYLERLEDGSTLTNFGDVTISDDVPEELLQRKIGSMTNFGDMSGPSNLLAALQARCHMNFGDSHATDQDDEHSRKAGFSNQGKTVLTREQLMYMEDGSSYSNQGKLTVADDVPADLLAQKIARYENQGKTYGPAALIGVLQAHCPENQGKFVPTGALGVDDDEDDE